MLRRNSGRALTMCLGIALAVALVVGVFSYIDYSQNEVIERAVEDIYIDLTVFQNDDPNSDTLESFNSYIEDYTSLVDSSELIFGTTNIAPTKPGILVGTGDNVTFSMGKSSETNVSEIESQPAILLAINQSYFETFPEIFSLTPESSTSLTNSTIYVSTQLSASLNIEQGEDLNVTIQTLSFETRSFQVEQHSNFNISGIVEIDHAAFQNALNSFLPETEDSSGFGQGFARRMESVTESIVFMDLNTYTDFITDSNQVDINAIQIRLDHQELSSDVSSIDAQLNQLKNYIELVYFDSAIVSDLQDEILSQADQLNYLRLTLLYLALPSVFIGFYLTKYATDLVLMERKKEITALRAKSLNQTQIRNYVVIESFTTASIGTILGLGIGILIGSIMNTLREFNNLSNISLTITRESLILAIALGLILAVISGFNTAKTVMNLSIIQGLQSGNNTNKIFWKKFYIDLVLITIGLFFTLLNLLDFNPIPGFANAAFDLLVPICTWIGMALLLVRGLEAVVIKLEPVISNILQKLMGDIGLIISKGIARRPARLNQLSIILILILSFGFIIGTVSSTYNAKASSEATFAVGSDIRIEMPSADQLEYNVSEFQDHLIENYPELSLSPLYINSVTIGRQSVILIGIDLETFLDIGYFSNSYLQSSDSENTINNLAYDPDDPKIILSNTLANPDSTTGQSGRLNIPEANQFSVFEIGDEVPFRIQGQLLNVTIIDIAYYFPALTDMFNSPVDELNYAITDYKLLTEPLTALNGSFTNNANASVLLGSISSNGKDFNQFAEEIIDDYNTNFSSTYPIVIQTQTNYLDQSSLIGVLLVDLANMELILVLTATLFSFGIFISTTLFYKKKIFGTFSALGARLKDIWFLLIGEMIVGAIYAIVISLLLGIVVSYTYLGFLSGLFITPLSGLTFSPVYSVLTYSILILAILIVSIVSAYQIQRMEAFDAIREL
jgi:ABC-type antimicrobial peptide transport system permease subunit